MYSGCDKLMYSVTNPWMWDKLMYSVTNLWMWDKLMYSVGQPIPGCGTSKCTQSPTKQMYDQSLDVGQANVFSHQSLDVGQANVFSHQSLDVGQANVCQSPIPGCGTS